MDIEDEREKKKFEEDMAFLQSVANMKQKFDKFSSNIFKIFSNENEAKNFDGQVAGHGGILKLPNGSLLKRTNETELNFYKTVMEKNLPVKEFMPACYNFEPSFEEIKKKYISSSKNNNDTLNIINMENLLTPYQHPNVIDIKLGTRLYDENADEAKRQKMITMASISTALETGLLISAVQIYDRQQQKTQKINKNYGLFLLPEYLPIAVIRFFYNIVESTYGNSECPKEKEMDASFYETEPSDYIVGFLKAVLVKIKELKEAVLKSHVVIYGSSICIVYDTINVAKEVEKRCKDPENYQYPFSLHYIDFAHASIADPNLAYDESLMTGFNKLIEIIENYLKKFNKF